MIMIRDIDIERFWAKVDRRGPDECWNWAAGMNPNGYGAVYLVFPEGRKQFGAHRAALIVHNRALPPNGAYVLHSCDNKLCCNPAHLRYGSQRDNIHDAIARGRAKRPPIRFGPRKPPKVKPPSRRDKLTAEMKAEILERLARGERVTKIAPLYNVSTAPISNLKNHGKTWVPKP